MPLPLIALAERQAPMRRALRRLLGESRFTWREIAMGEPLAGAALASQAVLLILEDHFLDLATDRAIAQLRDGGYNAPVILISSRTLPLPLLSLDADSPPVVIIDRLDISTRLPKAARALLPSLVDWSALG
jgi:hypothetical protein